MARPSVGAFPEWEPPPHFDGYQVLRCVGRGTMGQVFLAHDTVLDRPVALKLLTAGGADAAERERLLVEARAVARLQHPNVVTLYRVGEVEGRPYLACEFVRGHGLDALPLPLPAAQVVKIGLDLARGLAAAHRRGVLHRDLKPANAILADSGEVKLLDFGLAKLVEAGSDPALTDDSSLVGTPAYMAPELWRGEPASVQSDIYSLGALLYHLCSGRPPHVGATLHALVTQVLREAPSPLEGVERALAEPILRCLRKTPGERFPLADALCEVLEGLSPERRHLALPEGNPYRGLQSFEAQHRALFFGRDAEMRALLERLRTEPFLLVAGTSGLGKSSLCSAGVLPRVREGALDGSGRGGGGRVWAVATLTPGKRPLRALAAAMAQHLKEDEEALALRLGGEWRDVTRELRRRARQGAPLCVFLDQLEELVTLSAPDEARRMAEVLEDLAVPGPGLRVLATCRADFIARLASLPGMGDSINRGLFLLRPLSPEGLRAAVVGPARAMGVEFESDAMVEEFVEAASRAEGALPLLQFALAELWEARDTGRRVITATALTAVGGVVGALARHADAVVAHLPPEHRTAARRQLLALVTLEGTRARRTEAELLDGTPQARAALAALVRGRLLTVGEAPEGAMYEVTHEALIQSWPLLRQWLKEDAELRVLRERLAVAAAEWERLGRRREAVWGPRQLAEAALLPTSELPERERDFVAASHQVIHRGRVVRVGLSLCGLLMLSVVLAGVRYRGQVRELARAQLAERQHQTSRRDELLSRLAAHDMEGDGSEARVLGRTPVSVPQLAPGHYVLTPAPLHPVKGGASFITRFETTFGE
ncbi:serine/threonine-protein kinase [Corallococcus caeni]|uniref:serine/threonine-protein kinase n=1 Tax=Corallococcus caeni TaxID=3082388 RepID=UPI0030C6D35F